MIFQLALVDGGEKMKCSPAPAHEDASAEDCIGLAVEKMPSG